MKVTAVTPVDAASDPKHPDHDRWVKETTLAMEVAHAQRVGGTLRDAEAENARLLLRMEALARNEKPAPAAPRVDRERRAKERGVTTRHAQPIKVAKAPPCGRCGICIDCKREKRVWLISQKKNDDRACAALFGSLVVAAHQYHARVGPFAIASKRERDRALVLKVESVCDRSIKRFGAWK